MLISDGRRPRPTSKKNRCLVPAGASQEGEPRSEILLDLPSFSLAAIYTRAFYCKERSLIFEPQPIKAGVIVFPCAVRAMAGIKLVDVPQPKPLHGFSPNFQGMFNPRGSRAD